MDKRLAYRILFLFLFIALSVFIFIHYDLYLLFESRNKLESFIKSYPYDQLIFIVVQIIQVVAAPIPGELTGIIGGYLYGPFWGTVYSTIGLTLGSWIAFMLARFFGEPLLETMVRKDVFEKFDHFMEHKGLLVSFSTLSDSRFSQGLSMLHHGRKPYSHGNVHRNLHSRTHLRHNHALHHGSFRQ